MALKVRAVAWALILLFACSNAIVKYPYRAKLWRNNPTQFDLGIAVTERQDGAVLFQYDDTSRGDHGFIWVSREDGYQLVATAITTTEVGHEREPFR